ncbi:PadR family transcriptional regulator [Acidobacteriota bacterium]
MNLTTRLEEAILIAIWNLQDNAYGISVNKWVSQITGKNYTMGALYFALDRLFRSGYVNKIAKNAAQEKGGRSRTYYRLTPKGKLALKEVRDYQISLWSGIPELAVD